MIWRSVLSIQFQGQKIANKFFLIQIDAPSCHRSGIVILYHLIENAMNQEKRIRENCNENLRISSMQVYNVIYSPGNDFRG